MVIVDVGVFKVAKMSMHATINYTPALKTAEGNIQPCSCVHLNKDILQRLGCFYNGDWCTYYWENRICCQVYTQNKLKVYFDDHCRCTLAIATFDQKNPQSLGQNFHPHKHPVVDKST